MLSWDALDPVLFRPAGTVTAAFLAITKADLRAAAQHVWRLPYGRNSDPNDPLIVLAEERGTCSTKHALLRRLAIEQEFDLALVLGIYEMTERNTPVGPVLRRHGISSLLEAHCFLRAGDRRIDVTSEFSEPCEELIGSFLHEEEISPEQTTHYKTGVHRKFLKEWMISNTCLSRFSFEEVWAIREECVARMAHAQ